MYNLSDTFEASLPELIAEYSYSTRDTEIKYCEGLALVKNAYETLLMNVKHGDRYRVIADADMWLNNDNKYFMEFVERRAKKGVVTQALLVRNDAGEYFKKYEKNYGMEVRFLPSTFTPSAGLTFTDKNAFLLQLENVMSVTVLKNMKIINLLHDIFELLWCNAKN